MEEVLNITVDIGDLKRRAAAVGLRTTILEPLSEEAMVEAVDEIKKPKPHNHPAVSREETGFTLAPLALGARMVNSDPACISLFRIEKGGGSDAASC